MATQKQTQTTNIRKIGIKKSTRPNIHKRIAQEDQNHSEPAHDEGEGNWIFSYADLITILMMFFILMLSISNVSPEKFNALKEALKTNDAVEQNKAPSPEAESVTTQTDGTSAKVMLADIALDDVANKASSTGGDRSTRILAGAKILLDALDTKLLQSQKEELKEFERINHELAQAAKLIEHSKLLVSGDTRRLSLQFPASAFFQNTQSDSVKLLPKAAQFASAVYKGLVKIEPFPQIEIESHSSPYDADFKIRSKDAAYLLTGTRGMKILELFEKEGAESSSVAVTGYGFSRPLAAETNRYGKRISRAESLNERIVIHLIRKSKDEVQKP